MVAVVTFESTGGGRGSKQIRHVAKGIAHTTHHSTNTTTTIIRYCRARGRRLDKVGGEPEHKEGILKLLGRLQVALTVVHQIGVALSLAVLISPKD